LNSGVEVSERYYKDSEAIKMLESRGYIIKFHKSPILMSEITEVVVIS